MSLNRCVSCKWWAPPEPIQPWHTVPDVNFTFGTCERVPAELCWTDDPGQCSRDRCYVYDQFAVLDYAVCSLKTRPEFGCVLYERKDDSNDDGIPT